MGKASPGTGLVTAEALQCFLSRIKGRSAPSSGRTPQTATPHTFCRAKKNRLLRARLTPPHPFTPRHPITVAMATGEGEPPSPMKTIRFGAKKKREHCALWCRHAGNADDLLFSLFPPRRFQKLLQVQVNNGRNSLTLYISKAPACVMKSLITCSHAVLVATLSNQVRQLTDQGSFLLSCLFGNHGEGKTNSHSSLIFSRLI